MPKPYVVVTGRGSTLFYLYGFGCHLHSTRLRFRSSTVNLTDDIPIGAGFWQGGFATDTRIYFVNNGTNTAVAYDFNLNRQADDDH